MSTMAGFSYPSASFFSCSVISVSLVAFTSLIALSMEKKPAGPVARTGRRIRVVSDYHSP